MRIDVSRVKFNRQRISVPQSPCGAFEVIKGLGTFPKASRCTQYALLLSQISKNKQHSGDCKVF